MPDCRRINLISSNDSIRVIWNNLNATYDIGIEPGATNIAPLNSPAFIGVPTAPTAAPSTNTTQLATTAFVQAAIPTTTSQLTNNSGFITASDLPPDSQGLWGAVSGNINDQTDLITLLSGKQATLISGTNIKTLNSQSLLGAGNITITADFTNVAYNNINNNFPLQTFNATAFNTNGVFVTYPGSGGQGLGLTYRNVLFPADANSSVNFAAGGNIVAATSLTLNSSSIIATSLANASVGYVKSSTTGVLSRVTNIPSTDITGLPTLTNLAYTNVNNNFSTGQSVTGNVVVDGQVYSRGATASLFLQDQVNNRYFHAFRTDDVTSLGGQNSGGTYVYPMQFNHATGTIILPKVVQTAPVFNITQSFTGAHNPLLKIDAPVSNTEAPPFYITSAIAANDDASNTNHVVRFGANIFNDKPAAPKMFDTWESNWFSGGANMVERHYSINNEAGEEVRLFSSTYINRSTLALSENTWDWRSTTHNFKTLLNADIVVMGANQMTVYGTDPFFRIYDNPNSLYTQFQQTGADLSMTVARNFNLTSSYLGTIHDWNITKLAPVLRDDADWSIIRSGTGSAFLGFTVYSSDSSKGAGVQMNTSTNEVRLGSWLGASVFTNIYAGAASRVTISAAGAVKFNTGYGAGFIKSDASGNLTSGTIAQSDVTGLSTSLGTKLTQGGDTFGAPVVIGTNDGQNINFKRNGTVVSLIDGSGNYSTASAGIVNSTSVNNASITTPANGPLISRNVADANAALIVNQIHASSTGNIVSFQAASSTVANITTVGDFNTSGGYRIGAQAAMFNSSNILTLAGGGSFTGVGIGKILTVTSTTEQLRLAYDVSNYTSFTVASNGTLTISSSNNAVGIIGGLAWGSANYNIGSPNSSGVSTTSLAQALFGGASTITYRNVMRGSTAGTLGVNHSYGTLVIGENAVTEAASGTHGVIASLVAKAPVITGAGATVTNTSTVYIEGAPTATVTGGNYALFVDDGLSRFDGDVELPTSGTGIILKDTGDGSRRRVTVVNGVLTVSAAL